LEIWDEKNKLENIEKLLNSIEKQVEEILTELVFFMFCTTF